MRLGGTFILSSSRAATFLHSKDPDQTCSLTKWRYGSENPELMLWAGAPADRRKVDGASPLR